MAYNIAVVDDTRLDGEKLCRNIHRWFAENISSTGTVTCFNNGLELLKSFEPEKFHIVFMDIIMQQINGIETARILRDIDSQVLLIFTTTSSEYAFDAFPLHAFDYVLKPYEPERLNCVLSEAIRTLERPDPIAELRVARNTYTIRLGNISAALSNDHFIEVVTKDGECVICSMTLRETEALLLRDPRFLVCNRGIIINMDCVSSLNREKDAFIMMNGSQYPIRKKGKNMVIHAFTQYKISRMKEA